MSISFPKKSVTKPPQISSFVTKNADAVVFKESLIKCKSITYGGGSAVLMH